jgi:hypothetical protein
MFASAALRSTWRGREAGEPFVPWADWITPCAVTAEMRVRRWMRDGILNCDIIEVLHSTTIIE